MPDETTATASLSDSSNPQLLVPFLQNLLIQSEEIDTQTAEKIGVLVTHGDLAVRFWARRVYNRFQCIKSFSDDVTPADDEMPEKIELLHRKLTAVNRSPFLAMSVIEQILKRREPQSLLFLSEYLDRCDDPFQLSFLTKNLCAYFPTEEVLQRVVPFLKHTDSRVVANTIEGIEKIRSDKGIPIFTQMLRHDNHRVRANALKALARYDSEKTIYALSEMLKMREKPHFVIAACHAVCELKNPVFLPVLAENLGYRLLFDDSLRAIRAVDNEESKAAIMRRHDDFRYFDRKLAESLGEIKREEAIRHPWYKSIRLAKAVLATIAAAWLLLYLFFPSPERVARARLAELAISADVKSMSAAILKDDQQQVELLLAAGVPADGSDEDGSSFFHLCATLGHQEIFDSLRSAVSKTPQNQASDSVESRIAAALNRQGENIYQTAIRNGQTRFLQYLAATGFDLSTRDKKGNSLLHYAVACNQEDILVFLLMQKQDVNIKNLLGNTPLHDAVAAGHAKMVYWLMRLGRADPAMTNNNGFSPQDLGLRDLFKEE